ncbi:MAG: gamma carbonic anhydrase family protein [Solobacterium sp.]|nr:gamma carbonic anhydrase family protein [Solobacterium sp.]
MIQKIYQAEGSRIVDQVRFGSRCGIWYNAVLRGDDQPITIGDRVNIQDNCVLHTGIHSPLFIGNDVTIGHGAIVHGCTVEDQVLIGMGAILMNDCHIGAGSIIGAGSLVTERKTFPPNSLIMGSPAKVVRQLSEEEREGILVSAEYYATHAEESLPCVAYEQE